MPVPKLREFLDSNHVKYVLISHSTAYTASEIAASAHVRGKDLAKTVIVELDGKMAMAVLPSSYHIDFDKLAKAAGASKASLAWEPEFGGLFPGCDVGSMPPFGNLYGMDVFVAKPLTDDEEIAFNAGSHTELVQLAYKDFERLVRPKIADFALAGIK